VPPRPGLPTGSRLPVDGSLSYPPPPPPHSPHPSQPGPSSPGYSVSSTANNYVPLSPGWPEGSRLPVGSMPVAGSLSSPPPYPPRPSQPGPSEGSHGSGPPGFSVNPGTLSSTGSSNEPTPPLDPELHSLLDPEPFPTDFWDNFLKGKLKRHMSDSDAVYLAQKDPRSRIF
jgi:hypothetical protein